MMDDYEDPNSLTKSSYESLNARTGTFQSSRPRVDEAHCPDSLTRIRDFPYPGNSQETDLVISLERSPFREEGGLFLYAIE
jgi:hypothetical protein